MKNLPQLIALVLLLPLSLQAQPTASTCDGGRYQDFDFWLGHWEVKTPDDAFAGVNLIEKQYGGCVIIERYANASGPYGTSINSYDRTTDKWYQTWADKSGLRLALEGGVEKGVMVMTGTTRSQSADSDGNKMDSLHKISWTPQENGSVIQHWQVRQADKSEWQTLFKGIYTKKTD